MVTYPFFLGTIQHDGRLLRQLAGMTEENSVDKVKKGVNFSG